MRAISIGLFLLRHAVVTPVIAGVLGAAWVAFYLVLLVIAISGNGGLGGPLALPVGLIALVAVCAIVGWGIFTPACAAGYALRSLFKPPTLAILLTVWLAGTSLGYAWAWIFVTCFLHEPGPPLAWAMARSALYLSVPLGLYWWATEGAAMLPDMAVKALKRFGRNRG
jgi:hypothetical protein